MKAGSLSELWSSIGGGLFFLWFVWCTVKGFWIVAQMSRAGQAVRQRAKSIVPAIYQQEFGPPRDLREFWTCHIRETKRIWRTKKEGWFGKLKGIDAELDRQIEDYEKFDLLRRRYEKQSFFAFLGLAFTTFIIVFSGY